MSPAASTSTPIKPREAARTSPSACLIPSAMWAARTAWSEDRFLRASVRALGPQTQGGQLLTDTVVQLLAEATLLAIVAASRTSRSKALRALRSW